MASEKVESITSEKIIKWFQKNIPTETVEYEADNDFKGTIILQEELSLTLIRNILSIESTLGLTVAGLKVTDIRNNWTGLCVDLESKNPIKEVE